MSISRLECFRTFIKFFKIDYFNNVIEFIRTHYLQKTFITGFYRLDYETIVDY